MPESSASRAASATIVATGVVVALYFGQTVLIPTALAVLLAFLLTPVVRTLERWRVGRILSVLAVGAGAYALLAIVAWALTAQSAALLAALPQYRAHIQQKIADVRGMARGGSLERLQATLAEATREVREQEESAAPAKSRAPERVVIEENRSWDVWSLPAMLGPWLSPLGTLGLVVVLVPFMLLERAALTDRVIRLMGRRRLAITTKVLDEAAERVSRYLLMQTIVNASYGVLVGLGLYALGLPYAVLWGVLATVLRFIPYVGPILAALAPLTLSLAVFDGWTRPLLAAGLFLVIELFSNLVLETVLYAGSAGVSQVALLLSVAFWTTLWGPIGLMLATPLTVCVVVFGKHVPELRFLVVLMSDERAVTPDIGYYQRLLAGDADDAIEYLEEVTRADVSDPFDAVLLPTLEHARRDRAAGLIAPDDERRIVDAVARTADALAPPASEAVLGGPDEPAILGCPALDRADEVALGILARLAAADGIAMEVVPASLLTAEVAAQIATRRPRTVVIGSVPPGGLAEARHLCKRLAAMPTPPSIVLARWGQESPRSALEGVAPDLTAVVRTLAEARAQLRDFAPMSRASAPAA